MPRSQGQARAVPSGALASRRPKDADDSSDGPLAIVTAVAITLLGFAATRGLETASGVLPVWPPLAVAVGSFLAARRPAAPAFGIVVGAVVLGLVLGVGLIDVVLMPIALVIAGSLARTLIHRSGRDGSINSVKDAVAFLVAGVAIPATVDAAAATGGLLALGTVANGDVAVAAIGRALAGATGIVLFVPWFVPWWRSGRRRRPTRLARARFDWVPLFLYGTGLIAVAIWGWAPVSAANRVASLLLVFPVIAVARLRCSDQLASGLVLMTGTLGFFAASFGQGSVLVTGSGATLAGSFGLSVGVTSIIFQAVVHAHAEAVERSRVDRSEHQRLLAYAPDLIVRTNRQGDIAFANRSLPAVGHAEGGSLYELFDGNVRDTVRQHMGVVFTGGKTVRFESPGPRAPGRPQGTWLACHAGPLRIDDRVVGAIAIIQDVTERRSAERRLRDREARLEALFSHNAVGIVVIKLDGTVDEANPAALRMRGMDDSSPPTAHGEPRWVGAPYLEALADEERANEEPLLTELLAGRRSTYRADARWRGRGDGKIGSARMRTTVTLVRDDDGVPLFAVAIVEDIEVRLRAKETDRLASERLHEIERLSEESDWKTHLLNVASHELKNPLVPIQIQARLLRDGRFGPLMDDQEKAIGIIEQESVRLSQMVRDVLDVARLEVGTLRVEPTDTAIEKVMSRSVAAYQGAASARGVSVTADVPSGMTARLDGDRIQQVLSNLLANAVRFSPRGATVAVRARADGDGVLFEVTDQGPGIEAGQMERLFQSFSQLESKKKGADASRGTGLGLYICKGLVEAHGGTIGCRSDGPGTGSTFWFTIPH